MNKERFEVLVRREDGAELIDVSAHQLDIVLSKESLDNLMRQLEWLREGKSDHFHFFSEVWGDGEITTNVTDPRAFNMLTIYLLGDEG